MRYAIAAGALLGVLEAGQPPGGDWRGRVGDEDNIETGARATRDVGLNILAQVRTSVGGLDEVERVIKVVEFVNAAPSESGVPLVVNGCWELMQDVVGEAGRHTRSAVGCSTRPMGIPREIEAVFQLRSRQSLGRPATKAHVYSKALGRSKGLGRHKETEGAPSGGAPQAHRPLDPALRPLGSRRFQTARRTSVCMGNGTRARVRCPLKTESPFPTPLEPGRHSRSVAAVLEAVGHVGCGVAVQGPSSFASSAGRSSR